MAAARELNARERKRVYMHSTIFDNGGPTSKSIYAQNQQNDLYEGLTDSLRVRDAPSMDLPRPSDMQCTQNAGHGVVMPSNVGVDCRGSRGPQSVNGQAFRTSCAEVMVNDGDIMPVVKAGNRADRTAIPQEYWQTSVNLQWHDPTNERSRPNKNRNKDMGAQELKMQELSSEIFGQQRMNFTSTANPSADLLSTEADYLQVDSSLNRNLRQEKQCEGQGQQPASAYDRFTQNLGDSNRNTMSRPDQAAPAPMPLEEDPGTVPRRRQEKNFSDLFGTQMGERRDIRDREEVLGTRTCSFLDTRAEIAVRNKDHWRGGQSDLQGADIQERPRVSNLRKEAETDSSLFERRAPQKPQRNSADKNIDGNERVCWDTSEIMSFQSEIARRSRLKDFEVSQSAPDRKHQSMASQGVRQGIGGEYDLDEPQFSPRGSSPRANRITDPPRTQSRVGGGGYAVEQANDPRPRSAKDTKLASLQSSIFG